MPRQSLDGVSADLIQESLHETTNTEQPETGEMPRASSILPDLPPEMHMILPVFMDNLDGEHLKAIYRTLASFDNLPPELSAKIFRVILVLTIQGSIRLKETCIYLAGLNNPNADSLENLYNILLECNNLSDELFKEIYDTLVGFSNLSDKFFEEIYDTLAELKNSSAEESLAETCYTFAETCYTFEDSLSEAPSLDSAEAEEFVLFDIPDDENTSPAGALGPNDV
ncbi:MAG: hypothetical protein COA94_06250 [Rickettsiales bacterium]|nr:MAG: hypothetical protein COA94_06250 [Rickettsiales bacterium]